MNARPAAVRRVRVWFGKHPIADYCADEELALRYEAAMNRRFAGLRVTNDPVPGEPSDTAAHPVAPLPDDERQWPLTTFGGGRP